MFVCRKTRHYKGGERKGKNHFARDRYTLKFGGGILEIFGQIHKFKL